MKVKLSKSKKIILLISGFGILTTSIVIPVVVLNSNKNNNQESENEIKKIISKIKNKDILIASNVSTQNQSEIQSAIKNQLQKENQFLTPNDLSKISTNLSSLTLGNKIEVTLTIKINSASQNLKIHIEKLNLLKNSNIISGEGGTIFQDEFKNLWIMVIRKKLQVLKADSRANGYVNEGWTDDDSQGLLKNSNITNGYGGTIFQDEFKNLWTMGRGKKLQVLKVNSDKTGYESAWSDDETTTGLLNGSNIVNGYDGTIFQDSFKNLWTMGLRTKLQVLKVNSDETGYVSAWSDNETTIGLLNGSNITNGYGGTIFQDEFKNLWTMGNGTKLQVLKVNSRGDGYVSTWSNNNQGLLNGSNILDGYGGKIFQDSFKNLWAMESKKLQVLKVNSRDDSYVNSWTYDNTQGLLNGSNIVNGIDGIIFQDFFKNFWTAGWDTKLQVLKINSKDDGYESSWSDNKNAKGLLNGSNIANGGNGILFQDEFKNLWAMGSGTKLQILKVNSGKTGYESTWNNNKNAEGLLKDSNITDGYDGKIFQDSFKNLWTMGNGTKLQVLKVNVSKKSYVNSWQN